MNPKFFWLITAILLVSIHRAEAQQPAKIHIGYLAGFGNAKAPGAPIEAFRQGLRELGYIEGKNILVEYRYIEGRQERVASFVSELVHLPVDVLVIPHTGAIFEAKHVAKTIPIVIVTNIDPVANGIVDSLARPSGNITGVARLTRELAGKRLELLSEDRGRERLSPSPPSEPCVRFSRTRLSSRWFPHRDRYANT